MDEADSSTALPVVSLCRGGLFGALERRLGLVADEAQRRTRRIAAFVGVTWGALLVLSAIDGVLVGTHVVPPFLLDPAPHARFLLALPLLLLGEGIVDGMLSTVQRTVQAAGLVPASESAAYAEGADQAARRRDRWWVDLVLLVLAYLITWLMATNYAEEAAAGTSSTWIATRSAEGARLTLSGLWYAWVSVPLIQFLALRWGWRFIVWAGFLRRLSNLDLALVATHPDRSGGLGVVSMGQKGFTVVFLAGSAVLAGVLGHGILHGNDTLGDAHAVIVGYVIGSLVLLHLPLVLFMGLLLQTKRRGLMQYGALGSRLSRAFREHWVDDESANVDKLLESPDPSSVADYAADYETVQRMSVLPVSLRGLIPLAIVLLLPFLPLVFTQRSVTDVLKQLTGMFF